MDFVSKIGDILFMEKKETYQVVDRCKYEGENYLFLASIPGKIEEVVDIMSRKVIFATEVVDENKNYGIVKVEDEALIKVLQEKFKDTPIDNQLYIKRI